MKYAAVISKGPTSYGAMAPDLPGCYAVGEMLEETRALIAEAIAAHIKLLREDGDPVPQPGIRRPPFTAVIFAPVALLAGILI